MHLLWVQKQFVKVAKIPEGRGFLLIGEFVKNSQLIYAI